MALIGEDCHFFITSGCVRGNQCAFRHQPAARATEVSCPDWIQGKCLKPNCGLRHIPVDRSARSVPTTVSRKNVPCYYDSQPSGCWKHNCPFLHVKKPLPTSVPANPVTVNPVVVTTHLPQQNHAAIVSEKPVSHLPASIAPAVKKTVIPPPAPVHSLEPAVARPTLVNGVLHLAPTRGILGAPPGMQVMAQPVLVNQNRPLHMVQQNQAVPRPPVAHASLPQALHPSVNTPAYPKSEHFNEQVRLFKEMLSTKQNNNPRKQKANKQYYDDADSDNDDRKRREKHRERSKRNKKEKQVAKTKKKSKEGLTKADAEVLYGDYKDIPIDKKHKKSKQEPRADSDSEVVNIKSYEEVLREKALRKLMDKRKEKFNDDFDDIIQSSEKAKKVTKTKKYSSDGDETVNTKLPHRKSKRESIDLENEVFSQEDAIDLEIDNDEFSIETEEEKHQSKSRKHNKEKKRKHSTERLKKQEYRKHDKETNDKSEKIKTSDNKISKKVEEPEAAEPEAKEPDEPESQPEEDGVLIIPDETTDINFSVDDTDELALELNQDENVKHKKKRKPHSSSKKMSSIVSFVGKSTINLKSKTSKVERVKAPEPSVTKEKAKRKIMVVDTPVDTKRTKAESLPEVKKEKKKVINLTRKNPSEESEKATVENNDMESKQENTIKIKTFKEIMAEKRKRKLENNDVVVLSDNENSPMKIKPDSPMKTKEPLRVRSEKVKLEVLVKVDLPKSAALLRREKLKQAREEYEKRRKSQQLYKPKSAVKAKEARSDTVKDDSVIPNVTSINSSVPMKTIKLQRVPAPAPPPPATAAPLTIDKNKVTVRSFEQIMEEKRQRKRKEGHTVRGTIDSKPIQSFLRRVGTGDPRNRTAYSVQKTSATSTEIKSNTSTARKSLSSNSSTEDVQSTSEQPAGVMTRKSLSTSSNEDIYSTTATKSLQDTLNTQQQSVKIISIRRTSGSPQTVPQVTTNQLSSVQVPIIKNDADSVPPSSIEDIQEALDENKRLREEDMLSDEEFEKEINDLCSDGDYDDAEDVDDDDFMMELQQMIDS